MLIKDYVICSKVHYLFLWDSVQWKSIAFYVIVHGNKATECLESGLKVEYDLLHQNFIEIGWFGFGIQ